MDLVFEKLSVYIGLPLDRVRYVSLYLLSYPLAIIFRTLLHHRRTSCTVRHLYSLSLGLIFSWACFKWQVVYLGSFVAIGYILLHILPPSKVHIYSMTYALLGVSAGHVYRLMTDYGGYTLDFTGPLMIMVQRVSYVAFSYHDGVGHDKEKLNEDQKKHQISSIPSLLEYFSYSFSFLTLLSGPSTTYKEYRNFITGENMVDSEGKSLSTEPGSLLPTVKKLTAALCCMLIFHFTPNWREPSLILDPDISLMTRYLNILLFCFSIRCQYYFAFLIVEGFCSAAGFGYNGTDKEGKDSWNITQAIDVFKFEFGTNIREQAIAWNMSTATWIRRVVYERNNSVVLSYAISALWHGFYPGYYISFIFIAFCTEGARKLRRLLWSHFQEPLPLKIAYDIISIFATNICKDLAELTFVFLLIGDVFTIWRYYFFLPLIIAILIIVILPEKKKKKKE